MKKIVRNAALLPIGALLLGSMASIAALPEVRAELQPEKDRKAAPDFHLLNTRKEEVVLSHDRGEDVLVNFWATECGGCRAEIPYFAAFDEKYRSQGFQAIGLDMDISYEGLKGPEEAWARVNSFVKDHRLAYPITLTDDAVEKAYRVNSLPATYLLDRKGRIAAVYVGLVDKADVEANLRTLLAER
jgi:cytochrome c biogenesis protein CcmG/thiol:disulfide interchange protein DsbE